MAAAPTVQSLASRVEAALPPGLTTNMRMFGGITFLLNGNMLCCASGKGLMVRVGAAAEATALKSPHASLCLGAGRPMAGFIMIEPRGLTRNRDIARWVSMARAYVETLPPKPQKTKRPKSTALSSWPVEKREHHGIIRARMRGQKPLYRQARKVESSIAQITKENIA